MPDPYPKRLIEVDLPIRRISAYARREKSIRHGFWSLAQALSALYPNNTDEEFWVDGVLARKKSFGS